ncbi:MAG: HAD-IA family hydrolase [Clostridia bacterium]|nr:HAD-IA family hydrolase [Clostridia bacterium]
MNSKAFIWDLDGTLLDSYEVIVSSLLATLGEFNVELDREEVYREVKMRSANDLICDVESRYGIPFDDIKDRNTKISNLHKDKITAIRNAKEILSYLKEKGVRNYVFTHRGSSAPEVLSNLGIAGYFEEVINGKDGFPRKPDPAAINYLVEKYDLDPQDTYYVGDRAIDVECAVNAGIGSILYLPEDSVVEATGKETVIIGDLMEIQDLIDAIK